MVTQLWGLGWAVICLASACALLARRLAIVPARLLLASGVLAVPLALTGTPERSVPAVLALALLALPLVIGCAAVAGLVWPVARPSRITEVAAVLTIVAALAAGSLEAMSFDARDAGCQDCTVNPLEISSLVGMHDALSRVAAAVSIAWGMAVVLGAMLRVRGFTPRDRRQTWPMLVGGAGIALLTAAAAAHRLALPADVFDSWAEPVRLAQLGMLILIAAGALLRLGLPGRLTQQVARSVLTATPSPAELAASIARAADDPDLSITYRRLEGARIGPEGRSVPAPEGRSALRLTRDGSTYAEVWHRESSDLDLLRAVASSSGLALEYVAAQARLRAETLEAMAARRRIVVRADTERKRLERDLHDGAQQGLIALSVQLSALAASGRSALSRQRLAQAQEQIGLALEDLRTVALGLFPVSLAEAGLVAGLRELADHTSVPLVLDDVADVAGPEACRAVYQLVLGITGATRPQPDAAVRVRVEGGGTTATRVTVTAPMDAAQASMMRPGDRFAALGGRLTTTTNDGVLSAIGEIPCES